jgi:hypothetical protein
MKPRSIDLHIQELVLHGFPPGDRYRIGDAVRVELARLLAEQGVPAALTREREVARLDVGAFEFAPGAKAEGLAAGVALSVHGGLVR